MMWRALILLLILAAPGRASEACLSPAEAREAVRQHRLMAIDQATRLAKARTKGEVVSTNLCRTDQRFMYVLAILSPEGRVVRIGVDATTSSTTQLR